MPSEHIVDGTQDGNKSNTGSVYAVHDTAEHEESGEVTTESSSEDGEEYEYTHGFFVNKSPYPDNRQSTGLQSCILCSHSKVWWRD